MKPDTLFRLIASVEHRNKECWPKVQRSVFTCSPFICSSFDLGRGTSSGAIKASSECSAEGNSVLVVTLEVRKGTKKDFQLPISVEVGIFPRSLLSAGLTTTVDLIYF